MKVTDLINLGKKSLEMFDAYIAKKKVKPPMRAYIRHFKTELDISEKGCRSSGSSEIIQKPDWSIIVFDFMEKEIRQMDEFNKLNHSIAKKYKKNINKLAEGCNELSQSAFWIETFIRRLLYEKTEDTFSDDLLIEYATMFKLELELSQLDYSYTYYLNGIFLEKDSIKINDNVLIRKVEMEDLEFTRDIFIDTPRIDSIGLPSSILTINISAKDEKECSDYVSRIFYSLRLYKLGSIYSKKSIYTKKTIIWPMGSHIGLGKGRYVTYKTYTVNQSETNTFVKFINAMEPKLNYDKEDKRFRSFHISLERYNSALVESNDIDRQLMTTVMGLESLFSLEKDRGENAFKLGIRVAKLLGHLSFDPENVRTLIEKAYDFRNKVVHGSYISQEKRKRMNEIFPQITDYLRVSLIVFIMNQEIGKDKIIEMIDRSTISDIQNKELKKIFEKEIKKFHDILSG